MGPGQFAFESTKVETYSLSTFSLAHGVLRRNFRDDLTEGSLIKQLTLILSANPSQPKCSNNSVTTFSREMPCKGLFGCSFIIGRYPYILLRQSSSIVWIWADLKITNLQTRRVNKLVSPTITTMFIAFEISLPLELHCLRNDPACDRVRDTIFDKN